MCIETGFKITYRAAYIERKTDRQKDTERGAGGGGGGGGEREKIVGGRRGRQLHLQTARKLTDGKTKPSATKLKFPSKSLKQLLSSLPAGVLTLRSP